jgi:hypothetical protein
MEPSLQIFQSTALASWWPVARLNRRLQARRIPPRGSSPLRRRHDRQHYTWRSGGQLRILEWPIDQKARQPTMLQSRLVPESGPVFAASMGCLELISRINARYRNNVHIFEIEIGVPKSRNRVATGRLSGRPWRGVLGIYYQYVAPASPLKLATQWVASG